MALVCQMMLPFALEKAITFPLYPAELFICEPEAKYFPFAYLTLVKYVLLTASDFTQ